MNLGFLPHLPRNARRFGEVIAVLTKYGLAEWLSHTELERPKRFKFFTTREGTPLVEQSRGTRLRLALVELGTTYIKFGQMLSTRPDIVGDDIGGELAKLQEHVPPDPPGVAENTIREELGRPVGELFRTFAPRPVASASIGQAHEATLPDGQPVIVKVRHPGIERQIESDLEILEALAELAEKSQELRRYQPLAVVREFRRTIERELDFHRERRNIEQFTNHFAGDPGVRFPRVFPALCTARVLTMERLVGLNLRDAAAIDRAGFPRDELARRGAIIWMDMIFRDGFFHADPHPGNLLVLEDGALGIIDCGMVYHIDETLREDIEEMLVGIARGDATTIARTLMRICSAPPGFDEAAFTADVADFVSFYGSQSIDQFQLGAALTEIARTVSRGRLLLPTTASQLIKVFVMLEGTAKLLNPTVNLLELIKPYQRQIARRRLSPRRQFQKLSRLMGEWRRLGEKLPRGLNEVFQQVQSGKFDIHLEHRKLEPAVNRLVMGMITSALFLGSALLWSNQVPPRLGEYSVFGVTGCMVSAFLGLRLIWKIWRNE
jgi:ubiquinone biosynthesis protein